MTWFVGEVAEALIPALKDDEWHLDKHRATHTKSKYRLWIANGMWFVSLQDLNCDTVYKFNLIEKFILWQQFKRRLARAVDKRHNQIVTDIVSARVGQGDSR
jgi:hypothetical protein